MTDKKFPKIIGIDQLTDETAMVVGERRDTMFVREALNVDIDAFGNVSRRQGATLQLSGVGFHSLYSSARGWLMACQKHQLGVYDPASMIFTPLVNMDGAYRTSYTELNGNLYAFNPVFACKFSSGSLDYKPVGVPLPIVTPVFSATAGGLSAGSYGVTFTVVDPDGEESGTGAVTQIDLPNGGGILGSLFTVAAGYRHRIYMTGPNGEELFQALEFDADTTTVTVIAPELGRPCTTHGLDQPPVGHIVRTHGSRLLIGASGYVHYTEAFRPHLYDPRGFVRTSGFPTMIESVDDGVFISDNVGVSFYAGDDPTQWQIASVTGERAVFGTSVVVAGSFFGDDFAKYSSVAVWLTSSGYQLGLPNGNVVRLNASQVATPMYSQGSSAVLVSDGRKQLITPVSSNLLAGVSVALDSTTF